MRKLIVSVAVGTALVAVPAAPASAAGPKPPTVKAAAGLLSLNGKTIWKSNATARRPIASLAKVMTVVVVLREEKNLDRPVKIKRKYTTYGDKWGATEARLIVGDRVKVRDLMYGTMLESGADAAAALADTYGPGYDAFVKKMNREAKRLGLKNTKYANFDGLPYPSQYSTYSTAAEQVKLGRYALRFPTLKKVIATKKVTVRSLNGRSYTWKNTNTLIGKYKGGLGIKTGYTSKAGYCLLFAAERGKKTQIGVVLGSPTPGRRFTDATRLLNWGFGV
ncbi:D-alanyl-D-alanine carboxypeptidase family protein [Actinocorallia sp. A-T 12471]|uniref:D-alanyl-D-alanine carboxypeptidase family protein n=1 Tax=Actinocorallia sp. A-T 12471 TaxID=3089813 RepID=UPI0029CE2695|nr:serine hydrolase [Actinocorallia sp. A-T 12471]MDX6742719.1 serine hydrolase [Actinocorallia sp. A-T 12471]